MKEEKSRPSPEQLRWNIDYWFSLKTENHKILSYFLINILRNSQQWTNSVNSVNEIYLLNSSLPIFHLHILPSNLLQSIAELPRADNGDMQKSKEKKSSLPEFHFYWQTNVFEHNCKFTIEMHKVLFLTNWEI